MNTVPSFIG